MAPSAAAPSALVVWLHATRPGTLSASAVPVAVGTALAHLDGAFDALPAAAALAGALLIQIGTNYANDYQDHARGADAPDRHGPPRATAMGWVPPRRMLAASVAAFALAALVGLYLIAHAGWPILVIGLAALASGWAYTGGPYPLGYHGWGDLFVFVFFGLVAVAGTYYVQALHVPLYVIMAGIPVGCLATAILVVNNVRDLETDRRAGKRTLAVRLGPRAARAEYAVLLVVAYTSLAALVALPGQPSPLLLPLTTLPFAALLTHRIWTTHEPRRLNPALVHTARLLGAYGVLFVLGALVA